MQQFVYDLYLKYSKEPIDYRIKLAQTAYRKVEEKLKDRYNSWDAFNGVICLTLMCLCGDGDLTYNDYEIFKKISKASPTYNELCETVGNLNYKLIVDKYRVCGQETLGQALYLVAVVFACKGSYGDDEKAIVNALSHYYV